MRSDPADPASSSTGPLSAVSPAAGLPAAALAFPGGPGAAYIYSYDSDADPVIIAADLVCTDGPVALHPLTGGRRAGQACESPGARE